MLSNKLRYVSLVLLLLAANWRLAIAEEPAVHRSRAEMEQFLLNAEVLQRKALSQGVTNSEKALLSDGKLQHEAHVQSIDVQNNSFTSSHGTELNFKDSYKYNIAAYRLDKIMDLNMIPVSVVRKIAGKTSAVTWWVDDKMFDDVDRKKQGIDPPNQDDWNQQMYVVRVFDQLIYNTDRNLGNLVIDKQWRMWMIDHTRAFRLQTKLLNEKNLVMCDRRLLANMKKLDEETLQEQLMPFLTKGEIKAMLTRRDLIVKYFDKLVKEKGEGAVLYDMPPRT